MRRVRPGSRHVRRRSPRSAAGADPPTRWPSRASAVLIGIGLTVTDRASSSGASCAFRAWASSILPAVTRSHSSTKRVPRDAMPRRCRRSRRARGTPARGRRCPRRPRSPPRRSPVPATVSGVACLTADEVRVARSDLDDRARIDVHDDALRDVVEHERQVARAVGDRAEVAPHALDRRLVVVRRDREEAVHAEGRSLARQRGRVRRCRRSRCWRRCARRRRPPRAPPRTARASRRRRASEPHRSCPRAPARPSRCATRWRASAREAPRSSEPSVANGVTIAVRMRPSGAGAGWADTRRL